MAYSKQTWINGSGGETPLSAARLNHIEDGLEAAADAADTEFALPDQTGNSGKFLTTDGTDPSWDTPAGGSGLTAADIHALTTKTTPVDGDEFLVLDSAASFVGKRSTLANIKAVLKSYFDSVTTALTNKDLTSGTNTFPTFNQNTTGSAAKWTTARTVQTNLASGSSASLDGTASVTPGVTGVLPLANGGTGSALVDPDADRIPFWDDSAGAIAWLTPSTGLTITGTNMTAAGGGGGSGDASTNTSSSVVNEVALFADTAGKTLKRSTGSGMAKLTSGVLGVGTAGTDYVVPGGALGTPSSGTLSGCTALPVSGITSSTSTALGVGSVELGHASDTTVTRSEAGLLAVEGVVIPTITGAKRIAVVSSIPGSPDANTVYITPDGKRLGTGTTSSGSISINADLYDTFTATLTAATTFAITGTFKHTQELLIECVDNATSRAITWPSNTGDSGVATRLAATVISKVHRVFLVYDLNKTKWICMAVDAVGY